MYTVYLDVDVEVNNSETMKPYWSNITATKAKFHIQADHAKLQFLIQRLLYKPTYHCLN